MRVALARDLKRAQVADGISLPAPVGGWDAVSSLANMKEDRAIVLDNWFPRPDSVEVRKGRKVHASGMGSTVVESLLPYHGVSSSGNKLFAALGGDLYDVTAEATASVTSSVTGVANNRWQHVNFTTSGGKFLWICNGADTPRFYNGSLWTNVSITGITSTDIVHVNAHHNRLWFVLKDSTKAAYLNTDSVQGTATSFELGGQIVRGGYLVAMASWTRDGGSGPDDIAVFFFSTGEYVIYQGTDPAAIQTWDKIGTFYMGAPIGRRCLTKVGGDVAVIGVDGVIPLSKTIGSDAGAAAAYAMTQNINNAMKEAAQSYKANFGWELCAYTKGTMALLNVPIAEGTTQHQYVMNTLTGAWCRFTGWNANCFAVFNDNLYFGGNDGKVYRADFGGYDNGAEIQAIGQGAYNYLKSRGVRKNYGHVRAMVTTGSSTRPSVGVSTDFADNAVIGTPTAASATTAVYDTAIYDTDVYAPDSANVADWQAVNGEGNCASIHFRASTNAAGAVTVRISGFDMTYTKGGFI